jgi:hypothetical protein
MNIKSLIPALLVLVSACATIPSQSRVAPGELIRVENDSVVSRDVADGVVHRHIVAKAGPWNIHVVAIDLNKTDLTIESARAFDSTKGRETTSSIAKRKSVDGFAVLAAINADFFNMQTGENDLIQVIDGEIVKGVKRPLRALFGMDYSRTPRIDKFIFDGVVLAQNNRFPIDGVNILTDSLVVLNHVAGSYQVSEIGSALMLKRVRRNEDTLVTIAERKAGPGEYITLGDSALALRALGTHRRFLDQLVTNDTVRLVLGFLPKTKRIKTLVGGLPRIVVDGRNIAATDSLNGINRKFVETRHPRTGVGFSQSGTTLYFVTVDGRQTSSAGMSLAEFADCMIQAGCYQALNLDGGGSTTMVVDGTIVNSPSDAAGERPVANVLLLLKKKNADP